MDTAILPSTLLLTLLMSVGLFFFIRASTKDRTETAHLVSQLNEASLMPQLKDYFRARSYRVAAVDPQKNQVTMTGFVKPSWFLAIFLTVLAAVGFTCLSLMLSLLFSSQSFLLYGIVLLSPLSGIFYWSKAGKEEKVLLTVEDSNSEQNTKITVIAHRDEIISLEEALEELKLMEEAWGLSLPFGWFPLFEYEGEYFSVVGAEENTENSLILRTYEGIDIIHRSLTNMMLCIAEFYETGAYYIGESGNLEENEVAAKNILLKYNPEFHSIITAKTETVDTPDGFKVINKYHPDSNSILESRITDSKCNTIKSNQYFQGKLYNRMTYNREIEDFYDYICEENWFNDYEKNERFTVEYQYKCVAPKIERRYINGVLKTEIIHPDRKRDNSFLVFALFISIFQFIFSIFFFIYHSLRYNQQKQ